MGGENEAFIPLSVLILVVFILLSDLILVVFVHDYLYFFLVKPFSKKRKKSAP